MESISNFSQPNERIDGLFSGTQYDDDGDGCAKGKLYEEWVRRQWPIVYNGGIRLRKLTFYKTQQNQYNKGETIERVEIKHDTLIDTYNRICIETHEKSKTKNEKYIKSGILRDDNTVFYLVGDYFRWFLFAKEHLIWLYQKDPPFLYHYKTGTSIGYCLPIENAKRVCLDYHEFTGHSRS